MLFKNVSNLDTLLQYCAETLSWRIDEEYFEDLDELTYDFEAADLGLKEEAFTKIKSLKQLRPLVENQPWGIFAVDFESKKLEISAVRKILCKLICSPHNADYKTWACDQLLFLCFWGESAYRTIGFIAFEKQTGARLPIIKPLYCTPKIEDRAHIENFENQIKQLKWNDHFSNDEWIIAWRQAFRLPRHQTVRDTKAVTERLAEIALNISNNLIGAFNVEAADGTIHQLYKRFNEALNITLAQKEFIDMYAQTLVYGLFSARCMKPNVNPFTTDSAIECIPKTNPLLRELLVECCDKSKITGFDEIEVQELIDFLNGIEIQDILNDFNRQTGLGKEDPIVYFYEGFLDIYEKEQKKRRGVYYTPTPVVDFMVQSVSELLESKFGCSDGFLDDNVSVLDPAVGTGTFLRKIIFNVHDKFIKKRTKSLWSDYVHASLLTRIFGFEFMMAPYAVAHMKLAMTLKDTGYSFDSEKRLQVYLANSLENTENSPLPTNFEDPLFAESSYAAQARKSKINVIIGNPPYRTDSINKSNWILSLMEDYKKEPGTQERLQERNPKVVNDDYVKFIRFAQEVIKEQKQAIIAYIHPHSYMDNLTFRGMRWNLLKEFDEIYILDLHGNVMSRETFDIEGRDENVFDIQQGVCISFFIKNNKESNDELAKVFYSEAFGSRVHKYEFLLRSHFSSIEWHEVTPTSPYYFLNPKDFSNAAEYENGIMLSELFPVNIGGIKTHNDEALVSDNAFDTGYDQIYEYRPFDTKHIDYDLSKVERHRYDVMKHFVGHDNIGLVINRQVVTDNWSHVQMVEHMIDNRLHYSRKGIPLLCPLYLYDETGTRTSNVNSELIPNFEGAVSMKYVESKSDESTQFDVLDLADYCYAILFSNTYRAAYKEFLCIEFPRVTIPTSKEFFLEMICRGRELRELHTMHKSLENNLNIEFVGNGNNEITNVSYTNERIKINSTQSFINVREDLWDFCFGGYHGLQKWFKDRKHSCLNETDIKHVIAVLNIFDETQKLMVEIDDVFSRFEIDLRA